MATIDEATRAIILELAADECPLAEIALTVGLTRAAVARVANRNFDPASASNYAQMRRRFEAQFEGKGWMPAFKPGNGLSSFTKAIK